MNDSIARTTDDLGTYCDDDAWFQVYRVRLPDGYLGFTSAERGGIWIEKRASVREQCETLLHEVCHMILGHSEDPDPAVHDAIEKFAVRAARDILALGG